MLMYIESSYVQIRFDLFFQGGDTEAMQAAGVINLRMLHRPYAYWNCYKLKINTVGRLPYLFRKDWHQATKMF